MPILTELTNAEALAYGLVDLDLPAYEKELDLFLEELNFDLWLEEIEDAAAYRQLVANYR